MATRKRKRKGGRWLQKASARMKARGTKGSYGHKTVAQMKRDKAKGGAIARKANFALNAHRISARRKKRSRRLTARR